MHHWQFGNLRHINECGMLVDYGLQYPYMNYLDYLQEPIFYFYHFAFLLLINPGIFINIIVIFFFILGDHIFGNF